MGYYILNNLKLLISFFIHYQKDKNRSSCVDEQRTRNIKKVKKLPNLSKESCVTKVHCAGQEQINALICLCLPLIYVNVIKFLSMSSLFFYFRPAVIDLRNPRRIYQSIKSLFRRKLTALLFKIMKNNTQCKLKYPLIKMFLFLKKLLIYTSLGTLLCQTAMVSKNQS